MTSKSEEMDEDRTEERSILIIDGVMSVMPRAPRPYLNLAILGFTPAPAGPDINRSDLVVPFAFESLKISYTARISR